MNLASEMMKLAINNKGEKFKNLLEDIHNEAMKGNFCIEFNLEYKSWLREAHVDFLKSEGFNVSIFELNISGNPKWVNISWSKSIEL